MMPQFRSAFRLLMWPLSSELSLFLTLSSVSLILCLLESWLPDNISEDSTTGVDLINDTNSDIELESSISMSPFGNWITNTKLFVASVLWLSGLIFLTGKTLYFLFFGHLNETEKRQLTKMLSIFIFLRFVILSGAIGISSLSSLFVWLIWFAALGLLRSCAAIATVRCSRFSASSRISRLEWIRMFSVIAFLGLGNGILLKTGLSYRELLSDSGVYAKSSETRMLSGALKPPTALGVIVMKLTRNNRDMLYDTVDVIAYMVAESVLLFSTTVRLLGDLLIQAFDRWKLATGGSWSKQVLYTYYLDLIHVLFYHSVEMVHYMHLLLWSRLFSVASLIVFLHARSTFFLLTARIRRHLSYRKLGKFIASNFTLCRTGQPKSDPKTLESDKPSTEESKEDSKTDQNENEEPSMCAICWETLNVWRRLPCGHEFHEFCLRNWLEQNSTCPTCRRELGTPSVLSQSSRATAQDQAALGMLLRNWVRRVDTRMNNQNNPMNVRIRQNPLLETAPPGGNPARNLFAATVGLNLGVSIGSAPIVSVAAQAAARDAVAATPGNTFNRSVSSSSQSQQPSSTSGTDTLSNGSTPNPAGSQQVDVPPVVGDPNSQILRRSFHFDGSRYFSWLPSLHVELSEVFREVFASGAVDQQSDQNLASPQLQDNVLPTTTDGDGQLSGSSFNPDAHELIRLPPHLRVPAQEIAAMFPQFPLSAIVADLLATGFPEITVENLIQRPIPSPPRRVNQEVSNTAERPSAVSDSPEEHNPSPQTDISTSNEPSDESPLSRRRRSMLERARRRFFARTDTTQP